MELNTNKSPLRKIAIKLKNNIKCKKICTKGERKNDKTNISI